MRVLITGARGFVGRHLAAHLTDAGDEVIAFDRDEFDVRDAEAVERGVRMAKPGVVYHLAAQSSVGQSFRDPMSTFTDNVLGTVALFEAVKTAAPSARIILLSSSEVYGIPRDPERPLRESDAARPVSPYAASKLSAELIARQYARAFGVDQLVLRCFTMIGPGQSPTFALPSFAAQLARIASGAAEAVMRVGNLDVERDMTDVRDAVRAMRLVATLPKHKRIYNLCSGRTTRLADALALLIRESGVNVRVDADEARLRPTDIPRILGSCMRLSRDTGWKPAISVEESLRALYRANFIPRIS